MRTVVSIKPKKPTPHEIHMAKWEAEIGMMAADLARCQTPSIKRMIEHNMLQKQLRLARSRERARVKQAMKAPPAKPAPAAAPVVVRKKGLTKATAFL
jgi:hypothetical protein